MKTSYKEVGMLPVVDQGQDLIAGFVDDYELRFRGRLPVIVFGDHTRILKYIDFPFAAGADGTRLIAPSSDFLDVRFFYYALCNLRLKNLGYSRHFKLLREQTVRYPESLAEQRKIAAILASVDGAIEKTQAVVDQAQVVKRGVMQDLFTRGLPGRHARFKQTEIGGIPDEWTISPLTDACCERGQYGANVAKSELGAGKIRYIRITDISEDGTLKDDAVGIDAQDAEGYLLRTGDIVLARSGATVGKSYLHVDDDSGLRHAFAGYLVRFRTRAATLLPAFLKEYLNTAVYWRWIADRQRAQAQPNINAKEYGQLPVPCPPLDEQAEIVDIATAFIRTIQTHRAEIHELQRLKRGLLSALLTGELRVTPNMEAA